MQTSQQIDLLGLELSKSNIEAISENLLLPLKDDKVDVLELDIRLKFIEETVNKAREKINSELLNKNIEKGCELFGAKISKRNGYAILDYEQDSEYLRLKNLLEARKEVLTQAHNTIHNVVTEDGEIVPKVSVKSYTKDSVSYTFKK